MSTLPAVLSNPIKIKQGDTFSLTIAVTDGDGNPVLLDDREACMQMRNSIVSPVVLELSTDNGMLSIDGNEIELNINHQETANLSPNGRYVFDLQTMYNDTIETILSGNIEMIPDVTYDCGG